MTASCSDAAMVPVLPVAVLCAVWLLLCPTNICANTCTLRKPIQVVCTAIIFWRGCCSMCVLSLRSAIMLK